MSAAATAPSITKGSASARQSNRSPPRLLPMQDTMPPFASCPIATTSGRPSPPRSPTQTVPLSKPPIPDGPPAINTPPTFSPTTAMGPCNRSRPVSSTSMSPSASRSNHETVPASRPGSEVGTDANPEGPLLRQTATAPFPFCQAARSSARPVSTTSGSPSPSRSPHATAPKGHP